MRLSGSQATELRPSFRDASPGGRLGCAWTQVFPSSRPGGNWLASEPSGVSKPASSNQNYSRVQGQGACHVQWVLGPGRGSPPFQDMPHTQRLSSRAHSHQWELTPRASWSSAHPRAAVACKGFQSFQTTGWFFCSRIMKPDTPCTPPYTVPLVQEQILSNSKCKCYPSSTSCLFSFVTNVWLGGWRWRREAQAARNEGKARLGQRPRGDCVSPAETITPHQGSVLHSLPHEIYRPPCNLHTSRCPSCCTSGSAGDD